MITQIKTVKAHAAALYWKKRMEVCERYMKKHLQTLATHGSGKHETEYGFFVVSENNSYPAADIMAQLTPAEITLCKELKWSNARAKVLFPEAYEAAKTPNGYKVSI